MNENSIRADIERFLLKMEEMPNTISPDVQYAVSELADSLDIGRITVDFVDKLKSTSDFSMVLYEDKEKGWGNSFSVVEKHETRMGTDITYTVYPKKGVQQWSDEGVHRIKLLLSMLFVFNGRSWLMRDNHRLNFFDQDMNIYNLRYFFKHTGEMIAQGKITGYAAIYMNLKRFSVVNLQLGRHIGNLVMRRFIDHINSMLSGDEIIARIGGDNFAILVTEANLPNITSILEGTAIRFDDITGDRIMIAATAGVYIMNGTIPVHSPSEIMDRMSIAVNAAKLRTKHDIAYFDGEMMARNENALHITSLFQKALEDEEFLVYYQPKIATDGYKIAGAEALCRWKHEGQIISPADFIPVLERDMAICRLDFYMLDHVCRDIRRWLDEGRKVVKISVNLSRRHLSDLDLLSHIMEIIDRNNVPHEYIEIELTETTTDVEFKDLKRVISGLQAEGVSTSVDDFGVGYSSLTLIKDIPWNVLKVDKSFLPDVGSEYDKKKRVMLRYVVAMAQDMGLECVAEGVETREQLELLKSHCCDLVQGFYFDRPLPVDEFETRLDEHYNYTVE